MLRLFAICVLSISCAAGETPAPSEPSAEEASAALPNATVETSTNGEAAPGTGGQLTPEQLQSAIAAKISGVKQRCWQPALDAAPPGPAPSVRVPITLTIDPSGTVVSVVTAGEPPPGFPELPACIAETVRTWKFPPSSGSTTVNVPFVFVTQAPPPAAQP